MPLPKSLWGIYYLTRPFRLAIKVMVMMISIRSKNLNARSARAPASGSYRGRLRHAETRVLPASLKSEAAASQEFNDAQQSSALEDSVKGRSVIHVTFIISSGKYLILREQGLVLQRSAAPWFGRW